MITSIKRRSRAGKYPILTGSMIGLVFVSLIQSSLACLSVELVSLQNGGVINDYLTPSDEINVNLGIINILQYYTNNIYFKPNQKFTFPTGSLVMPCFDKEKLFILLQEVDITTNDRMYIEFDCEAFQIGNNTLTLSLYEDHSALMATTSAIENISGYTFGFTAEDLFKGDDPATYLFNFNVTEVCVNDTFDNVEIEQDTGIEIHRYNKKGVNSTVIQDRIVEEEKKPEPLLILANGTKIVVDANSMKFSSFVSLDEDQKSNYVVVDDKQRPLLWYELALPFGLGLIIVITMVCIILQCRKNRILSEAQQKAFDEELARAEQDGIEIPDDLKKSMKGRANYSNKANAGDALAGAKSPGGKRGKGSNMPDEEALEGTKKSPNKRQRMKKLMNDADNLAGSEQKMLDNMNNKPSVLNASINQVSVDDEKPVNIDEIKTATVVQPELMDHE